ncbi:MAG: hypothetical protein NTX44_08795 [Ignavibacteriales bacterium]|nr:hypothetical protein [Ignavibacteriales bacterium]
MKKNSIWVAAFCLFLTGYAQAQISEAHAIEYVKRISPSELDSTLPEGKLSDWLTKIFGKDATVEWELNDCGEQTGNPYVDKQRDLPICVEIYAKLAERRKLWITILVGTDQQGIIDSPAIYSLYLESDGQIRSFTRLSQVANALTHFPLGKTKKQ